MFEVQVIENTLPYRPRPTNLSGYHRFSNEKFDVFVHIENVLQAIADSAKKNSDAEIVGRLVGRSYRDDRGIWAVVTGEILACFEGGPANVRTTPKDGVEIAQALEQEYPTQELMGWYHSHIIPMDDYSSTDKANQSEWRKPYHIGLLVVVRDEVVTIHAFRGPEAERLNKSFVCKDQELPKFVETDRSVPTILTSPNTPSYMSQVSPDKSWIRSLAYLVLWPAIFLIGMHVLANALAQIQLPVVVNHPDKKWKSITNEIKHSEDAINNHTLQLQHEMREINRMIDGIHDYQKRDNGNLGFFDWLATHTLMLDTDIIKEQNSENHQKQRDDVPMPVK